MNSQIKTYKELMAEKARLTGLMHVQQQQVKDDFSLVKDELKPITNITGTIGKFFTRKAGNLVTNLGINLLINGFVKNVLLSKSGWFTRLIIPFFLKNYASNLVEDPGDLAEKIVDMFSKNGKADHAGMEAV